MFSYRKKFVPSKVKTKLLTILGILITLMVAIPSILSYKTTLQNAISGAKQDLSGMTVQINDKLTKG